MIILGINAYHGDAAAAIIRDGVLVAAAEEERFNRVKHCAGFPAQAVRYCLHAAGVSIEDVDHIGISRDPSAHLHKKILFAASRAAKGTVGRRQKAVNRNKEGVGSAQWALGGGQTADGSVVLTNEGSAPGPAASGNGRNGKGILGQIKDRFGNAAK